MLRDQRPLELEVVPFGTFLSSRSASSWMSRHSRRLRAPTPARFERLDQPQGFVRSSSLSGTFDSAGRFRSRVRK